MGNMQTRMLSMVVLLLVCSSGIAQRTPVSSPQPYVGSSGVVWSHTFQKPGATNARLTLSIDLGPGDELVLKDAAGMVQRRYQGRGPIRQASFVDRIDQGGRPSGASFLSGAVSGSVVTAELRGTSGGYGITVHAVRWGSGQMYAFAASGRCDLDVVVPAGLDDVEGNAASTFPWNATTGMRAMYSYGRAAVDFDRPVRICGIRYRPNGSASSTNAVDYDLRLDVSTSRNPGLGLDHTFDNNHGADRVTVFDGILNMAAASGMSTSPNPFILEIPFDVPFEWDPRSGPMLIDIRMRGATNTSGATWDIETSAIDSGRIVSLNSGANAAVADFPAGTATQNASLVVDLCLEVDVAPVALAATAGPTSSAFPFGKSSPMRVLYAYDESTIGFVGRHKISQLSFRTSNAAAFAGDSYDLRLTMSTGSVAANNLSATFDANHGTDKRVVFEGVHAAGPAVAGTAPGLFVVTIPLQTPFEYNPANGPLLVDMQLMTGATSGSQWDGVLGTEPVYRIYNTSSAVANSGTVQQFALAVGLTAEPIPTLPEADDSSFGSSASSFPWNTTGQQRVMYQYGSSTIATNRPLYIQHLSWRPDSQSGSFGPVSYTCTVDLSTSAVAAGAMTPAFNNNHGADRTRVFDGTFTVPYTSDLSDPNQFPMSIKLDEPFFFDPANGPLLVDIRMLDTNGLALPIDGSFGGDVWRFAHLNDANSNIADYPSSGNPQNFALNLRLSGEDCNATSVDYGVGCAGSGGLATCVNLGLPTLPSPDFAVALRNGPPNSFGFLALGLTQSNIPLDALGAPGCVALSLAEVGAFGVPTSATGYAQVAIPLPNDAIFAGFQFVTQWVSLDAVNQLGLSYSNAQLHTTCY